MKKPRSPYQSTMQKWICGGSLQGQPCRRGPDARGHCQADFECLTVRFSGELICRRIKELGGPCKEGPNPDQPGMNKCSRAIPRCKPIRSLRARRGWVVRNTLLATILLLAVGLAGPWRRDVISPGPVTRAHAAFGSDCQKCHTVANAGGLSWFGQPRLGSQYRREDSERCLLCHDIGPHPLTAHNVDPHRLQLVTQKSLEEVSGSRSPEQPMLDCSTCHTEHRGRGFDLQAMSNRACQSCHVQTISNFAGDHPEFGGFPHSRPTGIRFDHASHAQVHHGARGATFECSQCHTPSSDGRHQRTAGFQTACGSCHATELAKSGELFLFRPPRLDGKTLTEIGQWPQRARSLKVEALPPIMQALLRSDPEMEASFESLESVRLHRLGEATPEVQVAARKLAWGIKKRLLDLDANGEEAIQKRLASSKELTALLTGQKPEDRPRAKSQSWHSNLARLRATWFANLETEVESLGAGQPPPTMVGRERLEANGDWNDTVGWSLRSDGVAYRPMGHDDPMVRAWLDRFASGTDTRSRELFDLLASRKPARACQKCHSVAETASGERRIAWHSSRRSQGKRSFTNFDHGPHLLQPSLSECSSCHLTKPSGESKSGQGIGLEPIPRAVCATCHDDDGAPDGCLTCHAYHVHAKER